MEANNHFNYGPHSSVSANSGLKHSSGDSLYTNGSSMSFPQQGKNLNGQMNVNGITTAGESSQPGAHPPSSSYPHMSNHHLPGSMGYDYLWDQSQYSPAMGPVPPHGLHQKPGSQGGIQPQQPQHHFQSHGPYQVNGSMGPSQQPPGAGLQYWGRGNPGQQSQGGSSMPMGYNSPSIYGTYPNQGIPASQHHQQPPALQHQSATAHHLQHHSHHQQQQQQHYGVMPNGMPFYQHPSHQAQTQSQPQAQMIPPAAQSFTPPRGSPQHHHMGSGGGRSSPHHVQVPMRSPSTVPDSGSPKSREMQVSMNESFKEMDKGFNGVEKSSVPQRLPKTESFPVKPPGSVSSTDYNQAAQHSAVDLEKPVKQRQEMGAAAKELSSSPVSGPPPPLASPPRKTLTLQDSHSPSSPGFALSTALGVGANASVSPPSPLTPPLQMVQGQRPGFSGPSSAEGTPAGLGTAPSMSSPKSSRAPPAGSHNQSLVFSSKTLMHPPTVPVPPQTVPEAQGSKSQQVSPTPLSLAVSPSVVSTLPALAPLKGPQEASPLTGQSPKHPAASSTPTSVADNVSLSTVSALPSVVAGSPQVAALASSAPPPAVSYSPQASSASLNVSPNVSRSLIGSVTQPLETVANMGSHGVVRHNFGESHSRPEACGSQSKVGIIMGTSKKESNNETQAEMHKVQIHGRNLELAFIVPKEPERDTMAVGRKDSNSIRAQTAPRKGESETLNDTFGTDTSLDYPSLAESTYLESSRAEDGSSKMDTFDNSYSLSQTGDQSKFTEGSMIDDSRDLQDTSCEEENLNSSMTSTSSTEEASLKDTTSLLDDSLNDTSQNSSSLLSASINASSLSIKGEISSCYLTYPAVSNSLKCLGNSLVWQSCFTCCFTFASWRREIRVRRLEDRLKGETWYYSPCGRRMKQFPEVIKYLNRHQDALQGVSREHFSFSPRMPVGDFYEERESPEGMQWFLLANEEVPSMIMAITGRRGRPPNPDKEPRSRGCRARGAPGRRPGRPPKPKMEDLLSKVDARLLKRLEAKEDLTEQEKEKLIKIKKKMKRKPLPQLSRIPGLVLSGLAFSNCLRLVEFLHGYGKILGLQVPKDIPSLSALQEGLLGMEKSQGELLDLLIKLVEAALHDPGLPSYYQSVKILGEKLVDLELSHSTVSEVLRIFLEAHGFELEVCNSLRTKSFQTLKPDVKASILAFLVEELNASNIITRSIDNTLENMTTYRKNKWIIEGKLRKLKAALMRKTGRPEEELCFEERRRSARVGVAEEESIEESCVLERGSRRKAKEEPKHTEIESPNSCSVAELERQIDKLTKRQVFFRKKLQQSSHSMRAVSLGQDRYRRRYLLLPYMGCVLVEGAEDILASGEVTVSDEPVTYVKVITPVKTEVKAEPPLSPAFGAHLPSSPRVSQLTPTEADPLPGEASLMSSPRGRGRPRKIKPEVELHLRTAKNRRRRRSSRSAAEDSTLNSPVQDPVQFAFQTPLEQPQHAEADGSAPITASGAGQGEDNSQPEDSMREQAGKRGQWFNLLPKEPCDETSISQPCENTPASASSPTEDTPAPLDSDPLAPPPPPQPPTTQTPPLPLPQVCSTPAPRAGRRRRRSSGTSRALSRSSAAKRRGRPPSNLFQEVELKYFTQLVVKPIPLEMVKGWWWIREPAELTAIVSALHPRGIREKVLHKHLTKHREYLSEVCTRLVTDPIFQMTVEDGDALLEASKQAWSEQERVLQLDISVLQWVEDLEQRVVGADLQLKVSIPNAESDNEASQESSCSQFQMYTPPEADSTREDLQYYEHEIDPKDDWMVKTKKEWSDLLRAPSNPLDLAVLRLTNLERNIERRYLKEPLWNLSEVVRLAPLTPPPGGEEVPLDAVSLESEITPRLKTWRQALDRCRSASQLSLCLLQLEKAIAWERSVIKVTCQICRKGDDDEYLLLCDGCDRGCHMFCLRPKVMQVPEGDWFCPTCVAKENGEAPRSQRSSRKRSNVRKRRFAEDSSDEDDGYRRGMTTRQKDAAASSSGTSISPSKRRQMATRNQPDLTYCEIILMEMEAHSDAWPFLEPVNPRLVPGYRRIIKTPMDFLTMRERLLQGGYCSCEEFAADAQLVFNNCELFNEDTSEVGKAGHSMRRFFESRWVEFYENNDK
uniref:Bromodomain adjacent to zinc finger domain protein 2A-like n=1 Tax=Sinocyclocheilus rhinocerous TaxID=307959 RepID=A0A673K140_9TELE